MNAKHIWLAIIGLIGIGCLTGLLISGNVSDTHAESLPVDAEAAPPESRGVARNGYRPGSSVAGQAGTGGAEEDRTGIDSQPLSPTFRRFYDILRNNGDVRAFVDELLPEAEAGNAEARFLISQALLYCEMYFLEEQVRNEAYWEKRKAELTEKGWTARDFSFIDDGLTACRGFWEAGDLSRYRSKGYWLKRARDAGYGPALAFSAAWSGMMIEGTGGKPSQIDRDVARALKSGHPVALEHAAAVLKDAERFPVAPRLPGEDRYMAMMIVACRNGLPCGRGSFHWRKGIGAECPHCESLVEAFEYTTSAGRFREIREAADAIERAIARRDWGALGLETPD